jgi:hypothetical protein
MADELIMGLVAVLLGSLRKRSTDDEQPSGPPDTEQ